MTEPENLERERASDVPEGGTLRKDGSYAVPADVFEDENEKVLADREQARTDREAELADRELANQDNPPRELGTNA